MAKWEWKNNNIHVYLSELDHNRVKAQVTPFVDKMQKIPDRKFYNTSKVTYYQTRAELLLYPEYIFGSVFQLKVNTKIYEFGDPGFDFKINDQKLEIRTAPWIKGYFPIRDDVTNPRFDIGVLIVSPLTTYDSKRKISYDESIIVGYFTRKDLHHAVQRFDQGKENWVIYQKYLRPIRELFEMRFGDLL